MTVGGHASYLRGAVEGVYTGENLARVICELPLVPARVEDLPTSSERLDKRLRLRCIEVT